MRSRNRFRSAGRWLVAWMLVGCLCAHGATEFELHAISSRADVVSGGNVLVQLNAPAHSQWAVALNSRDVTATFKPAAQSDVLFALLDGLKPGKNAIEIRSNGKTKAKLEVLDHAVSGPIFSGPHQKPFVCQTEINGLGPALDDNCSAHTMVQYYYKSTVAVVQAPLQALVAKLTAKPGALGSGFKPYDPTGPAPPDVAQTVTSNGQTVRYIVRREIGTINRAVYDIQFLHDPEQPLPTPWKRTASGWNGRLVYDFGGGCGSGYRQGALGGAVGLAQGAALSLGYAVATSTLNVFGNNCNDRISAETLSMVKEHFIEQFGAPVHTIGTGASGGAMQQHLIAQNYPGLLDGIIVSASFPDLMTYVQSGSDCQLLEQYFQASEPPWSLEQKTAVSGFATWQTCQGRLGGGFPVIDPQALCSASMPKEMIFDRATNPSGVRCDIYENEVNVIGRDPKTTFARRPLDNIGVQYGLAALNAGLIDVERFLDLNQRMGGYDADGKIVSTRTEADPKTLGLFYQTGLVLTGGGGLGQIPIIDWRGYTDDQGDNHDSFRSLVTRERLIAANGGAQNHVILTYPPPFFTRLLDPDPARSEVAAHGVELLRQMDQWLDNLAADKSVEPIAAKISASRPGELTDGCLQASGKWIVDPQMDNKTSSECGQLYPPHGNPRIAAGAPFSDDVLKCALKPIDPADYSKPLSAGQLKRLHAIFPSGVCDYSRPGIGQQVTHKTWQRF